MMPKIESIRCKQFCGAFEAERFSRLRVQLPGNRIQFALGEAAQIAPLGKVLSQQAIGVFIDAPLPGTVWVSKEHLYSSHLSQSLMFGHLLTLIVSQREPLLLRYSPSGTTP